VELKKHNIFFKFESIVRCNVEFNMTLYVEMLKKSAIFQKNVL